MAHGYKQQYLGMSAQQRIIAEDFAKKEAAGEIKVVIIIDPKSDYESK